MSNLNQPNNPERSPEGASANQSPEESEFKFSDTEASNSSSIPDGWRRTKSGKRKKNNENNQIRLPKSIEQKSYGLVNFIGYSFLIFSVFDYLAVLFPLRLLDPFWEFQTFGQLVERVAIPLISILFIFYRRESSIPKLEAAILKGVSWLCLALSILYLLLLPLGIVNTVRINNRNNAQIAAQLSQQSQQIKQGKEQINRASSKELEQVLNSLNQQGRAGNITNTQELKELILNRSAQIEQSNKLQAEALQSNQKTELFKNSIKWNLGTILAAISFWWLWRSSSDLRKVISASKDR